MQIIQLLHLDHALFSTIIILCVLLVSLIAFKRPKVFGSLLLHPFGIVKYREYHRLLTSQFIHGDHLHLISNIIMLYASCVSLENHLASVSAFGSLIFLGIYLVVIVLSGVLVTFRHYKDPDFSSAGASGGVMGCMFCFMTLQPDFVAFYLPVIGPVKNIFAAIIFILVLLKLRSQGQRLYNHELHFYSSLLGVAMGVVLKFVI